MELWLPSIINSDYLSHFVRISSIDYLEKDHKATIAFKNRNAVETALMVSCIVFVRHGKFFFFLKKKK